MRQCPHTCPPLLPLAQGAPASHDHPHHRDVITRFANIDQVFQEDGGDGPGDGANLGSRVLAHLLLNFHLLEIQAEFLVDATCWPQFSLLAI